MKILVISLAGIGDTLIATPLLHELRVHYPVATIDVFVLWAGSMDILASNPHINTVHQKDLIKAGFIESLRYIRTLRRQRYDVVLNTHPQSRIQYRMIARLIGAPRRLSHVYDNWNLLDFLLVNRTVNQDYDIHSTENNLRLLSLLGKATRLPEHPFELHLSDTETGWALRYLQHHQFGNCSKLGLHIGSGGTKNLALKRWPLDHYVHLLQQWTRTHPEVAVLLFGGPEEQEAHKTILNAVPGTRVTAPVTVSLGQTAALMAHCNGFLSVDTALMHVAAALKIPRQVVIESPTLNATNVPWQNAFHLVKNPSIKGRHLEYYCYDGKPIQGTREELIRCMSSISVEAVHETLAYAFAQ